MGEHVHGCAAGEGERGRSVKINVAGQPDQRTFRHADFFGESAVPMHAEQPSLQAKRLLAARAKFAFPAEQVGLHCHAVPVSPTGDAGAKRDDLAGNLAARNARQRRRAGQAPFLQPEIEPVQPAGADPDNHLAGPGHRIGRLAINQLPRRAMRNELNGFHAGTFRIKIRIRRKKPPPKFIIYHLAFIIYHSPTL